MVGSGYGRPGGMMPRDPSLGIPHPADLLGRQYGDQIAHQVKIATYFIFFLINSSFINISF